MTVVAATVAVVLALEAGAALAAATVAAAAATVVVTTVEAATVAMEETAAAAEEVQLEGDSLETQETAWVELHARSNHSGEGRHWLLPRYVIRLIGPKIPALALRRLVVH